MNKQLIKSGAWDLVKGIFTALIGFLLAYITFSKQFDSNEKGRLNDNLNKILDVNLQYPYVEDSTFIAWWNSHKNSNSDSALRYQTYCEYVFNFLQNTCEYFNYNKRKIMDFVDMGDFVEQHKEWLNWPDVRNSNGFPKRFIDFINDNFK